MQCSKAASLASLGPRWLSDEDKGSPKARIGFGVGFRAIDHRQHGLPQSFGM
jgi:hypothetical protein